MSIKSLKHALELAEIATLDIEDLLTDKPAPIAPEPDRKWIEFGVGTDVEIRLAADALPSFEEPLGSVEAAEKALLKAKAFMAGDGPWDTVYGEAHGEMRGRN